VQWHGWWAPDRAGRTDEVVLGRGALAGEELCRLLEGGEATQRQVHVVAQDEDDVGAALLGQRRWRVGWALRWRTEEGAAGGLGRECQPCVK
jgi:hypothetical protein